MKEIHIGPHTHATPTDAERDAAGTFDREINLKGVFWTTVGLVAATIVASVLMWWMIVGFNRLDESRDPRPSPLPEANVQAEPPQPRLQTRPEEDLRAMRDEEQEKLAGIEKAMEAIVARGLGPLTPQTPIPPSPGEGAGEAGEGGQGGEGSRRTP